MKIVLDTNVLVAGLLTPHGPPGRILDGLLTGDLVACLDDRILGEYREVLGRPKLGIGAAKGEAILDYIETAGVQVVAPALDASLPDPEDRMFIEVAVAAGAECVVTGNVRHFPAKGRQGVRVLTPREFTERWRPGRRGS